MTRIELTGTSGHREAPLALTEALTEIFLAMAREGLAPQTMRQAVFASVTPEAFHPARHAIDLAWREVFAGFRPPITLRPAAGAGLHVTISFAPGPAPSAAMATLAADYSPRRQTDMAALLRQWTADGTAFRQGWPGLDLAYGSGRFETLDLYRPAGIARPPVWVFIHGGYWQATDKAQHAQFAEGMVRAGCAVAMPNYALAPDAPLETIQRQIAASLRFLADNAKELGIDGDRLHLAGHSAGAHLAAQAACDADAPRPRSVLLLSGLFDLEPLGDIPIGPLLGLDDRARARALSPIHRPRPDAAIALAFGARESAAFASQSERMAQAWRAPAPMQVPQCHHFNMLEPLRGGGPLLDLALELIGGRGDIHKNII